MSTDNEEQADADAQQSLSHDLRHSLFALRTGIDLLPHVRNDTGPFQEVHQLLLKELTRATDLLDQVLKRG